MAYENILHLFAFITTSSQLLPIFVFLVAFPSLTPSHAFLFPILPRHTTPLDPAFFLLAFSFLAITTLARARPFFIFISFLASLFLFASSPSDSNGRYCLQCANGAKKKPKQTQAVFSVSPSLSRVCLLLSKTKRSHLQVLLLDPEQLGKKSTFFYTSGLFFCSNILCFFTQLPSRSLLPHFRFLSVHSDSHDYTLSHTHTYRCYMYHPKCLFSFRVGWLYIIITYAHVSRASFFSPLYLSHQLLAIDCLFFSWRRVSLHFIPATTRFGQSCFLLSLSRFLSSLSGSTQSYT